jgi:hypothetical protein
MTISCKGQPYPAAMTLALARPSHQAFRPVASMSLPPVPGTTCAAEAERTAGLVMGHRGNYSFAVLISRVGGKTLHPAYGALGEPGPDPTPAR